MLSISSDLLWFSRARLRNMSSVAISAEFSSDFWGFLVCDLELEKVFGCWNFIGDPRANLVVSAIPLFDYYRL